MATLVLSTIGTMFGGPIGGVIGALIGQSFDQQLLGSASRGPRLGDLSVQSSSYGTQIPRIYGSMRVAGSVVWATDLVEGEQTTGAKGQPDVTYSYSVSLAVALSSRPVGAIGRIWADGKLLRGVEGDFKVPVTFRFYDGSESQEIDPLIASIEGIANTPAYRGVALAVFENFELAAFGNRIPFMTFEIIADPSAPAISSILHDASDGAISCDATQTVVGYAAYGKSIAAAVQPLVDSFDVPLLDDGAFLRSPAAAASIVIGLDELGSSADGEQAPKIQREQWPVRDVPSTLRLTYYDPDRDYQTGEARAIVGEQGSNEVQQELPAVLSASDAKALTAQILARQWAARDKLTLRLPSSHIALEPGTIVQPGLTSTSWVAEKCTVDGFVNVVELRPSWKPSPALLADAGRIVPNSDVVAAPTGLGLIDARNVFQPRASPTILIAASTASAGWSTRPIAVTGSGQTFLTQTAARKSLLGSAATVLGTGAPFLIDEENSVDIQLIDRSQWLTSCDEEALSDGANLAILGSELVQFGSATPLGEGRFRLARLLRARAGTERDSAIHVVGELFCLLDSNSLQPLSVPMWLRGSFLSAADRTGSNTSVTFGGESVTPLAPVNFSAQINGNGELELAWTRRSRCFAWMDEVDVPIGENREEYSIRITAAAAEFITSTNAPILVVAEPDLAALGSGPAIIEVRQIGDWAASRPAQLTIDLP